MKLRVLALIVLFAAGIPGPLAVNALLAPATQPATQPSTRPAWQKIRPVENRIISWFIIGWSIDSAAVRNIAWDIPATGWPAFVENRVKPQLAWGVRRVQLHNPFGCLGGQNMQFTQLLQAKLTPGLEKVSDEAAFVAAWKPITDSGVEVIAYIGAPTGGDWLYEMPAFERSKKAIRAAAVKPLIDAGVSIAIDAASGAKAGDDTHELMQELRRQGVRVYIEALAPAASTWLHDYPSQALPWFYYHADRPGWGVIDSSDETVLLLPEAQSIKQLRDHLGAERSIAIGATEIEGWISQGVTLADVVREGGGEK